MADTKFFHFPQNNSGGTFDFDEEDGLTHHVVIEAVDAPHANHILERIGGYFNGCSTGQDCDCCGDRWCPVDELDADSEPRVYGTLVADMKFPYGTWMPDNKEVAVHYLGRGIEWFGDKK